MAKSFKLNQLIKPKKKCCGSKPKCRRCPVVLHRLAEAGYLERTFDGRYLPVDDVKKKVLKKARKKKNKLTKLKLSEAG